MTAVAADNLPRGTLLRAEPLARHTWWAVGGPADCYFAPADLDDLGEWLARRDSATPPFWLGLGSNLLVRDGGLRADVVATSGVLGGMERLDGPCMRLGAGAACAQVARRLVREGLAGGEFLAGIPGTMGGALALNAGAHGTETWDRVRRVRTVDAAGTLRWRERDDFEPAYRAVSGPAGEWFVACELELLPAAAEAVRETVRELLAHRAATQPTGQRSCGSVFRNPPGDHAGRLIEAAGLKGLREGGAVVSEKHANFIVNDQGASARDIETLIDTVHDRVLAESGVDLVREVHVVGEP